MRDWRTLGVPSPTRDGSEVEQLQFVRDLSVRSLLFMGPIMGVLFILLSLPVAAFVVLAVAYLLQAISIARLTQRLRRARRRPTEN
ncbi:MAG: hypothetical protein QOE65_1171 [Solirubrobacteraceae bacterium]|jgi:hypothetical protein|nr:hypothetical protein [Solirubrobacteraceae bacterium]